MRWHWPSLTWLPRRCWLGIGGCSWLLNRDYLACFGPYGTRNRTVSAVGSWAEKSIRSGVHSEGVQHG